YHKIHKFISTTKSEGATVLTGGSNRRCNVSKRHHQMSLTKHFIFLGNQGIHQLSYIFGFASFLFTSLFSLCQKLKCPESLSIYMLGSSFSLVPFVIV
ncbi:hypothetical protein S83_011615, partial [Arachis hypogaea]